MYDSTMESHSSEIVTCYKFLRQDFQYNNQNLDIYLLHVKWICIGPLINIYFIVV